MPFLACSGKITNPRNVLGGLLHLWEKGWKGYPNGGSAPIFWNNFSRIKL